MADNNELLLRLKAIDELSPVMIKAMETMTASAQKMSDSVQSLNKTEQENNKVTKESSLAWLNLDAALNIGQKVLSTVSAAWAMLNVHMARGIDEAIEAEAAQAKLTGALVSSGNYTTEAAEALQDYINATEAATGASGEFISNAIATGLQMGLNTEQAKGLEEASRKLAAAQGTDLESALSTIQG